MEELIQNPKPASTRKTGADWDGVSQDRFDVLFNESLDAIIIIDDNTGKIITANRASTLITGREIQEIVGTDFAEYISSQRNPGSEDDDEVNTGAVLDLLEIKRNDGTICPIDMTMTMIVWDGKSAIMATIRDITERKQAQDNIRAQKAYYEDILNKIDVDISVFDPNCNYEYINATALPDDKLRRKIIGKNEFEFGELNNRDPVIAQERSDLQKRALETGQPVEWNEMLPLPDGERYYYRKLSPVKDEEGKISRLIGYGLDVTEKRLAEEKIKYLAYHDILTGLPNRVQLNDRLNEAIAQAQRHNKLVGVIFLDLDGFKVVNDSMGHHVGDQVLISAADRIRRCLRKDDLISRHGGDNFVILLTDIEHEMKITAIATQILESFRDAIELSDKRYYLSVSLGISLYPLDSDSPQILLKFADLAMFQAKEKGKNRYQYYTDELNQKALKRMELERDLRLALERNEFVAFFQPYVDVATNKIIGSETLVRWKKPGQGFISPLDFIPAAENNGLIVPIGEQVLIQACYQNNMWQKEHPGLRVSVNLSPRQFREPDLLQKIKNVLMLTGLSADLLELELTESCIMEDAAKTIETLHAIHRMGIKIAIDDFGTGYSSLSYLNKFPIDTLKIDMSFVRKIDTDTDSAEICKAIIALAHSLKIKVTAEGIERVAQMDILSGLGCEKGQGYLWSKPVPPLDFIQLTGF